jgi:vancomycin resistance protein YoaR
MDTYFPGSPDQELEISLNEKFLEEFVDGIGDSIDVETVDASMMFDGQKVVEFTPARDGQVLNRALTKELLLEKLSVSNISGEKEIVINLPVSVTKAKIANEEINSLGIKELIGRGVSYFSGSIANRIYNLSLGSQRISGTLVKPGEVFSFNGSVGEVSGATGYKPAYVISSGRTVLDDGGGICQVSTTVFRAALDAGLPIVSRTAHAYRVGYYELGGFKPGLDATVWAPAVDLSFKNDTHHHILVQAVVDPANAKLQVDIYGTGDGRRVELSTPVISNVTPAPEAKYQDDPSLPKGIVKQVDFAAGGANSIFTRKVFKGDELIIDESFRSNYRPWQAIYLVGTGG